MKTSLDLSIVIISFNTCDITRECLVSLYKNKPNCSFEVILVDNDSHDGSADMVEREFPEVKLIKNSENLGFAAANNQGFDICSGDYVLMLNSDTVILGAVLSKSIQYMENHPSVGVFGCRVLNTDQTTQLTCSQYPTNFNLLTMVLGLNRLPWKNIFGQYQYLDWNRDCERDVDVVSGCYLLTRQKIIQDIGGLDEDFFFFGEETEWCARIKNAGWAIRFSPVGEIIHYGGASAKKLNHKRDIMLTRATIMFHKKIFGTLSASVCFCLLAIFNGTRAIAWTLLSVFGKPAKERASHFRRVFAATLKTWGKA